MAFTLDPVFIVYIVGFILIVTVVLTLLWLRFKPVYNIAYLEQKESGTLLNYNPDKETPNHVFSNNGYRFRKLAPKYLFKQGAIKRVTMILARRGTMWTFKINQPTKKLSLYESLKDVLGYAKKNGVTTKEWQIDLMEPEQLDLIKKAKIDFTVAFEENNYETNLPEFTDYDEPNEQMALLIGRSIKKALTNKIGDVVRDLALMGAGVTVWNLLSELGLM